MVPYQYISIPLASPSSTAGLLIRDSSIFIDSSSDYGLTTLIIVGGVVVAVFTLVAIINHNCRDDPPPSNSIQVYVISLPSTEDYCVAIKD